MTDFTYTHKTDPVMSGSIRSQVIDCLYYNDKTKELLVGVTDNGNAYIYSGVPQHVYSAFANSVSKGYFWNKIVKPQYGPADDAGLTADLYTIEYGTVRLAAAGTPKGLVDPVASTSATVLAFPLKSEPTPAPVKTDANEVVFSDAKSTTVTFSLSDGKDRTRDFEDKATVRDAVAEITQLVEMLGLEDDLVIKSVTVHFE